MSSIFTEDIESYFDNPSVTDIGSPGVIYYGCLTSSISNYDYSLVVCHKQFYFNNLTQKSEFRIIVDLIKHWSRSELISNNESVIDYMIWLKSRFYLRSIVCSDISSTEIISRLKDSGFFIENLGDK